jgi:hypothetical protein
VSYHFECTDAWPDIGVVCCMGSAALGPGHCTCWEPVVSRAEPLPATDLVTRKERCVDCAFRPDSPERKSGALDDVIEAIARGSGHPFFCHQGLTPVTEYRHPSGAVFRPPTAKEGGVPMDYQPKFNAGFRPCKDDGTQQDVCAGWAAEVDRHQRGAEA